VLDHEDAIGTGGNWRSGHDLDDVARGKRRSGPGFSGPELANDGKRPASGEVGCAAGESVTRGTGKRRLVAIGDDRLRKDAVEAVEQSH
jgi:hypothetical protein